MLLKAPCRPPLLQPSASNGIKIQMHVFSEIKQLKMNNPGVFNMLIINTSIYIKSRCFSEGGCAGFGDSTPTSQHIDVRQMGHEKTGIIIWEPFADGIC